MPSKESSASVPDRKHGPLCLRRTRIKLGEQPNLSPEDNHSDPDANLKERTAFSKCLREKTKETDRSFDGKGNLESKRKNRKVVDTKVEERTFGESLYAPRVRKTGVHEKVVEHTARRGKYGKQTSKMERETVTLEKAANANANAAQYFVPRRKSSESRSVHDSSESDSKEGNSKETSDGKRSREAGRSKETVAAN